MLGEAAVLVTQCWVLLLSTGGTLGSLGAIPPPFGSWGSRSAGMAPHIEVLPSHLPFLAPRPFDPGPAGAICSAPAV